MSEKKRFQNQTLDSNDYKKIEDGAETIRVGLKIATALCTSAVVIKKFIPKFVKGVDSIFKA